MLSCDRTLLRERLFPNHRDFMCRLFVNQPDWFFFFDESYERFGCTTVKGFGKFSTKSCPLGRESRDRAFGRWPVEYFFSSFIFGTCATTYGDGRAAWRIIISVRDNVDNIRNNFPKCHFRRKSGWLDLLHCYSGGSLEITREFNERVACSLNNDADEQPRRGWAVRKGGNTSLACVSLIEFMKTWGRPCRVHRSLAR